MVFRWRRPLLLTYHDNYRYGTSLYTSTAEDVEKKYKDSLSRTYLRSDRRDLGLSTFSGSHLQGGMPASIGDTTTSGKKHYADLYEPMSFGYGRSYYDSLRASSEPRTTKKSTGTKKSVDIKDSKTSSHYSASEEVSKDIKSSISTKLSKITKSSSEYDTLDKKVTTTTTTTDSWVPLSHYLYPTTTSYYYYTEPSGKTTSDLYISDDVRIKKSSSSKNIDALDLKVSSSNISSSYTSEKFDFNFWTDKCREIQSHLDHVNRWVGDAESKIKNDLVGARNKMHQELSEVTVLVDDTTKYNEELQRVIKRQARQISDLHSQHDEINRHLTDVNDNLVKSRSRCQTLQAELANVQQGLEMASKRKQ